MPEHGVRVQCDVWPDGRCTNAAVEVLNFCKGDSPWKEVAVCAACLATFDEVRWIGHPLLAEAA